MAKDYAEAARFFTLAAEHGYTNAEHNLGCMCESGRGGAVDVAAARRWYERAAAKGHKRAIAALARLESAA